MSGHLMYILKDYFGTSTKCVDYTYRCPYFQVSTLTGCTVYVGMYVCTYIYIYAHICKYKLLTVKIVRIIKPRFNSDG